MDFGAGPSHRGGVGVAAKAEGWCLKPDAWRLVVEDRGLTAEGRELRTGAWRLKAEGLKAGGLRAGA